jgi:putative peptidoglycan lipid II flippase
MFAHRLSIASLAYGTTIGFLISCIIQFIYITSRKIFYRPFVIDFHFPLVREYIKKAIPFMIITSMSQICILVSYILSLNIGQGMASALSFAGKLNDIIINLFVLPFLIVLLPEFSRDNASNNRDALKSHIRFGAEAIAVIVIFCTAFMIVCNQEIVQLLFMRGKFTLENAHITGNILFIYMIGLCFQSGYLYLVFIYLGIQKTSSLLFIGGISYILNIVLQIILSHYFGVYGITAGISFASLIYFFVLLFTLKKNFISFSFFKQGRNILKIVGIIPFLIIVFIVGRRVLFTNENLKQSYLLVKLLILGGGGLFIYILCLIVLRIQIAIDLFNKMRYILYAKNESTIH